MKSKRLLVLLIIGLLFLPTTVFADLYTSGPDNNNPTQRIDFTGTNIWSNSFSQGGQYGFDFSTGYLYVSDGVFIQQIDQDGNDGWVVDPQGTNDIAGIAVDQNYVYVLLQGEFQKLDVSDGSQVIQSTGRDWSSVEGAQVGDKVYFADNSTDTVYALNKDGTLAWEKKASSPPQDLAIDSNNNIYVAHGGGVTSYDSTGTERWSVSYVQTSGIGVNNNGDIGVETSSSTDDFIKKLDSSNGSELCSFTRTYGDHIAEAVAVDSNGNIYYGYGDNSTTSDLSTTGGNIRKLDSNCNEVWVNRYFETNNFVRYLEVGDEVQAPTADFTHSPNKIVEGQSYDFTDQSTDDGTIQSWDWDFGDGNTSTNQNPTNTYTNAGSYDVTLTVTDDDGLSDSTTKTVEVEQEIVADFTYSPDTPVINESTNFTDQSSGNPTSWSWDFDGDGTEDSTQQNPSYTYTSKGSYTVTLTASTNIQSDQVSKTVDVYEAPNPDFFTCDGDTIASLDACFDGSYSSDDGTIESYDWDFGDGNTGSGIQPNHTYSTAGNQDVTLSVTDNDGITRSTLKTIDVQADPIAKFDITPDSPLVHETTNFTDQSSDSDGTIENWSWDLSGDGTEDTTVQNPEYIYDSYGSQSASLMVTDNDGRTDSKSKTFTVYAPPQPAFDYTPTQPNPGDSINFSDQSSDSDGTIESWSWDFGDGNTSSQQNPSHSYSSSGTYTVTLTVTDNHGFTRSTSQTVEVLSKPIADFDWSPENPEPNEDVQFNDLSSDPDGEIVSWTWDFGDGNISTDSNPIHVYSSAGTYSVTLQVEDNDGQTDQVTYDVVVQAPPEADFSYTPDTPLINNNDSVDFTDQSVDPDGTIQSWEWDFGDGSTSTNQNPAHTYSSTGDYSVQLVVTDDQGLQDTTTKTVSYYAKPLVDFSYSPSDPSTADDISFNSSASDSDGTVQSYNWDFGNGDNSSAQDPIYSFSTGGTHTISLTVTDDDGITATKTKDIYVSSPPVASFSWSPSKPLVSDTVSFTDESSPDGGGSASILANNDEIVYWEWKFGDGDTSIQQNPNHKFNSYGDYDVQLMVEDKDGLQDTTTQTVTVFLEPIADFSWTPESVTKGTEISFTDLSSDTDATISSWQWNFGDGDSSNQQNPTHTYTETGQQTVQLEVTDSDGFTDQKSVTLEVEEELVADFTTSPDSPLRNEDIDFIDQSSPAPSSWEWDFGDGFDSEEPDPTHSYSSYGDKTVSLEVSTDQQNDKITKTVTVYAKPTADFEFGPTRAVTGEKIKFTNQSSDPDGGVVEYFWDFGNGNTSTKENPDHQYTTNGIYEVTLTVTDNHGFEDKLTKKVFVLGKPEPDFDWSPTEPVEGESINFTDLSTDPDGSVVSWEWVFGSTDDTSNNQNPTYSFSDPGTYEVTLKATDNTNLTGQISKEITVQENLNADFTYTPNSPKTDETVNFTNESTIENGTIDSFVWEFGDGSGSNQENPDHVYTTENFYNVTLTITDSNGNQDSVTKTVEVAQGIDIIHSPIRPGVRETTEFSAVNELDVSLVNYSWDFGDGSSQSGSNLDSVTHSYSSVGFYTITLEAEDENGTIHTITNTIQVSTRSQRR